MAKRSSPGKSSKSTMVCLAGILLSLCACSSESQPPNTADNSPPKPTTTPITAASNGAPAPIDPEAPSPATGEASTPVDLEIPFELAEEALPSGSVTLSNGVVVRAGDWPALVVATFGTGDGKATCSGALVGPNVLLTAAHCVENGFGVVRKPILRSFGREIPMLCEQHPAYLRREPRLRSPRGAEDYAICWIDYGDDIPNAIKNMRVEVVETNRTILKDSQVLLTGYGCTDLKIQNGKLVKVESANILRIGNAKIARATLSAADDGAYILIESLGSDTPALCPGDSGGPMFTGITESDPVGLRRIAGVNSAIAQGASGSETHIVSKVSATSTPEFSQWISDWQRRNASNAPIVCGVSRAAGQFPCRS